MTRLPVKQGRLRKALEETTERLLREAAELNTTRAEQARWLGVSPRNHIKLLDRHNLRWPTRNPIYNTRVNMEHPWSVEVLDVKPGQLAHEPFQRRSKWLCFYFDAGVKGWTWERRLKAEFDKLPNVYKQQLPNKRIRIKTDDGRVIVKRMYPTSYGFQFQ